MKEKRDVCLVATRYGCYANYYYQFDASTTRDLSIEIGDAFVGGCDANLKSKALKLA